MPRQSRTANPVNEIASITNAVGPAWAVPAYSAAGNMTTIPQPKDPTKSYKATYDAWNRLTKLEEDDGAEGLWTVQENQYDGRRFRTVRKDYEEGTLAETRHFYYTANWQDIEERLGADPDEANPEQQFVWGQRYIDDCLLRDRDSNADGTLDERLYALQDGNWNVIALTDENGDVQERYAYSAYGVPMFLSPTFGSRSSSSYGWKTLYAGCGFDAITGVFLVRNRILHAVLGGWLQRDPLIYRDGPCLYEYVAASPLSKFDPLGLQTAGNWGWLREPYRPGARNWDRTYEEFILRNPGATKSTCDLRGKWSQGCVGVTSNWLGTDPRGSGGLDRCYGTLAEAEKAQTDTEAKGLCSSRGERNYSGKPARARLIEFMWLERKSRRESVDAPWSIGEGGLISWDDSKQQRLDRFDFHYFDESKKIWWGATDAESEKGTKVTKTTTKDLQTFLGLPAGDPKFGSWTEMKNDAGKVIDFERYVKVYCVVCEFNNPCAIRPKPW